LYESVIRSGSRFPPPKLADYFERTFFDCPWVDPEIPSLVYEDEAGKIAGFIGSHPRRLLIDGRPMRMGCSGQLVTDPRVRSRAVGAFLMHKYMAGAQDLTITDGATEEVRRIWEGLGGQSAQLRSIEWIRVFRPLNTALQYISRNGKFRHLAAVSRPVASALDAVIARPARFQLRPKEPAVSGEPLTPALLAEQLPAVAKSYRAFLDYDPVFLEWLFREMAAVETRGSLIAMTIRNNAGKVIGWYVYYLKPGGISEVVQVAAEKRDLGDVLDHLFNHAYTNRAAALRGRLEHGLIDSLSQRGCLLRYCGMALAYSKSPDILRAVLLDHALLTRMDGEWWMGHHIEPFV
jgi:hypothetical protein